MEAITEQNLTRNSCMNITIACLGWGSLVWDTRSLPIHREWFRDGPLLPVEFAHFSDNCQGRVTLVITPDSPRVRVLWALMSLADLDLAKKKLADRERVKDIDKSIGYWKKDGHSHT